MSVDPIRLTLITDAWFPQLNGVVNTLSRVAEILRAQDNDVAVIAPDRFRTFPCPTYPDLALAFPGHGQLARLIEARGRSYIHIATEGPLGVRARHYCVRRGLRFTTSFHTDFPEYLAARAPVPRSWAYAFLRWFHNSGSACMVATESLREKLSLRGFRDVVLWSRGVDHTLFRPRPGIDLGFKRPIFLSVGRVAVEKNLQAFLDLDLPGSKVVVGDGPAREMLSQTYPSVHFLGALPMSSEALAEVYAAADVFVFPSLTDTFGNVILEALSSGLPVAAFPVAGPKDVITDPRVGVLDNDLRKAALSALKLSRKAARKFATDFSWEATATKFRQNVLLANGAIRS